MHSVYHFYSSHGQTGYPAFRWPRQQGDIKNKKCFFMLFVCFCSINGGQGQLMKLLTVPVATRVVSNEAAAAESEQLTSGYQEKN